LSELQDIEYLENRFALDHIKALAWMIANQSLDIKLAIVQDDEGRPLDSSQLEESGIFHQKVGILYDGEGNVISFSGSDNETASAWTRNIEEFKVFRSFDESQSEYLTADRQRFMRFWNGLANKMQIIEVPQAVKKRLIEIAPEDITSLNLHPQSDGNKTKETKLWVHQIEAIDKWSRNDMKCIFEMATGTGKTLAALGCLRRLLSQQAKVLSIISCPYNHLITQWKVSLQKVPIRANSIIADSSNPNWKRQLADQIFDLNSSVIDNLVILTTHDTFYTQDFLQIVQKAKDEVFLIADEVHSIGSEQRKKGLVSSYRYRLGLSATPSRWFDPEGTTQLMEYFNVNQPEDAFSFPLEKAIRSINPDTGETYLTPYEYRPFFLGLTEQEMDEYENQTKQIARAYHAAKNVEDRLTNLNLLFIKRQDIIRNAANKYKTLINVLDEIGNTKHCLIYCSPQQIDRVQDMLNDRRIVQHRFTQQESTKPSSKYGGLSQRDFILRRFADGSYQALVAMRCLDEGVDIPEARIGIILASTGNPRQYIQRRGRILRRSPAKDKAIIYDLIVIPSLGRHLIKEVAELERKILGKELERYEEFAKIALNFVECLTRIQEIEGKLTEAS